MRNLVRSVCCAAVLASPAAMADLTGNAGVFSTYMFRGVDQSGGAASVQGGVDFTSESGLYAGTWVADTSAGFAGSTYETDFYGGWTGGGLDVGAIFYHYRDTGANDFAEVYAGWSGAGISAKVYFSPELGATEDSAIHATASYAIALSDTLSLTPQVGFSTGDAWETILEGSSPGSGDDSFLDYSVTLAKTLPEGTTFTFAYVANTLDVDDHLASGLAEEGQLVIGLKKAFGL